MKFMVFDDCAMITGYCETKFYWFNLIFSANLNRSYFENRIDRYILFNNSIDLSNYLVELTDKLKHVYHRLSDNGMFLPPTSDYTIKDLKSHSSISCCDPEFVYLYPCIQMKKFGLTQDSDFLNALFSFSPQIIKKSSAIFMCTGYFNLTKNIKNAILNTRNNWNLLTSSPKSNSFYASKGVTSVIPSLYEFNLLDFSRKASKQKQSLRSFEFVHDKHTFHAKGSLIFFFESTRYFLRYFDEFC